MRRATFTLPHLVGGEGIIKAIRMPLTEDESTQLHASAQVVKEAIEQLV